MFSNRPDYNSPEYKAWRNSVYARDRFACQMCHRTGVELNAHHIIRWADNVSLRYVQSNGITICTHCHDNIVTGREEHFAKQFKEIVSQKKIQHAAKKGKKTKVQKTRPWKPRNPNLRF